MDKKDLSKKAKIWFEKAKEWLKRAKEALKKLELKKQIFIHLDIHLQHDVLKPDLI